MATIVPEPSDSVCEAILAALRAEDEPAGAWAAAALAEGVDADADD